MSSKTLAVSLSKAKSVINGCCRWKRSSRSILATSLFNCNTNKNYSLQGGEGRLDGDLNGAVAVEQRGQDTRQFGKRGALLNEFPRRNVAFGDQAQGSADGLRRVVERALDGQFIVVDAVRVQGDGGIGGAAPEEADGGGFAGDEKGRFPGFRRAHRLDHFICAAPALRPGFQRGGDVLYLAHVIDLVGAHARGQRQALRTATGGQHARPGQLAEPYEHQTNRPRAQHRHRLARLDGNLLHAAHHARQRLHQGRLLKGDVRRQRQQVLLHDARRDGDILGVGPV